MNIVNIMFYIVDCCLIVKNEIMIFVGKWMEIEEKLFWMKLNMFKMISMVCIFLYMEISFLIFDGYLYNYIG